ncbi:SDR family NAD(P)-dependent oxidoreductase [Paenibacillus sp. MBLB4367]|uniref:SDR family NAD(P)-dependent oxidoreductase n=1 Tax=Paenibacillus sp. MBLB4367 TaxID=3384767 RepID=UPI003908081C
MHTKKLFDLDGQIAIVTGGSGLYGAHISQALCEAGATVIIASRNVDSCEKAASVLREAGHQAFGMQLDLGDEAGICRFVAEVTERFKQIDILVNNSVSRVGLNDLEKTTQEGWEAAQHVNGTGTMLITREVVKPMVARRKGNIINIGSIQGAVGPHFPVYGDTGMTSGIEYTYAKWGMVGMTKWLANYYGRYNIRVNCISPGGYNPVGTQNEIMNETFTANYKKLTPLGRFSEDDDIKGPIVFLASEASRYVTGHNLLVDGGWTNW